MLRIRAGIPLVVADREAWYRKKSAEGYTDWPFAVNVEEELKKWRSDIGDVVLQVTMRATEPKAPQNPAVEPPAAKSAESLHAPDASVLQLANNWAESNLRAGAPLSTLMKKRIRECVEEAVLNIVLSSASSSSSSTSSSSSLGQSGDSGASILFADLTLIDFRIAAESSNSCFCPSTSNDSCWRMWTSDRV